MDPQQRVFLQTCWHAIENAGYNPSALSAGKCGVRTTTGRMCARAWLKEGPLHEGDPSWRPAIRATPDRLQSCYVRGA